jgi:hypothetical protein
MRTTDAPIDELSALGLCRLLLRAAEPADRLIPVHQAFEPNRRDGFWERLDRWLAKARQRERERYLARARDVVDLEARIRALERRPYY